MAASVSSRFTLRPHRLGVFRSCAAAGLSVASLIALCGLARPLWAADPAPSLAVVTTTADDGPGSLRAALVYATTQPGTIITFAIPKTDSGFDGTTWRIATQSGLTVGGAGTVIDGPSQSAFAGNTNPTGPEIVLDGLPSIPLLHDGLTLAASECVVRGLVIHQFFGAGIRVLPGTDACRIEGNYIGTDATGTQARPNARAIGLAPFADGDAGIVLGVGPEAPAPAMSFNGHVIGGTTAAARNVISGNGRHGVLTASLVRLIAGNTIGTDATGSVALPNEGHGIVAKIQAWGIDPCTIGGTTPAARNVISGNHWAGVAFIDARYWTLAGNIIGLAADGTTPLPNGMFGVHAESPGNQDLSLGLPVEGGGNVISGNFLGGIRLLGDRHVLRNNLIGLDATGRLARPNQGPGISVAYGSDHRIGDTSNQGYGPFVPLGGNIISGNQGPGVLVAAWLGLGVSARLEGNVIGLNAAGAPLPNSGAGLDLTSKGSVTLTYNVISANDGPGVRLNGSTRLRDNNLIYDNAGLALVLNNPGTPYDHTAPTLLSAVIGSSLRLTGTYRGTSGASKLVVYATPAPETFSAGDLRHPLGSVNLPLRTERDTPFDVTLPNVVPPGTLLTAYVQVDLGYVSALATNIPVTATDSDGDGLPDAYEVAHGLDPQSAADAALDADGDGFSNRDEFTNLAAALATPLKVRLSGSDAIVTLPRLATGDPRTAPLRVETASDLSAAHWTTLFRWTLDAGIGGFANVGGPQAYWFTDPGAATQPRRFYRAVIDAP